MYLEDLQDVYSEVMETLKGDKAPGRPPWPSTHLPAAQERRVTACPPPLRPALRR